MTVKPFMYLLISLILYFNLFYYHSYYDYDYICLFIYLFFSVAKLSRLSESSLIISLVSFFNITFLSNFQLALSSRALKQLEMTKLRVSF